MNNTDNFIINILKDGELLTCGMFGCIYKFNIKKKYYCIKFNFRKEEINYNLLYQKIKNMDKIPKKYIYNHYDAEVKIQKILNNINGEDINNKKLPFTIKIYNDGKIINKEIINKIKNIINQKFIKKNNKKKFINEFIKNIKLCNEINYFIMDYVPNIELSNFIYDANGDIKLNKFDELKELHTYLFYIIYYLDLINKIYDFYHGDLHHRNIILVNDEEYDKNKIKYRIIKWNNHYYKLQIYKYRPYIIDFGMASIFNKNIINQNIIYYNVYMNIINKSIKLLNKNQIILFELYIELEYFYCHLQYNQINNYINYFNINKLKILEHIFNYKLNNIKNMNLILKNINKDYVNYDCATSFLKFIFPKLNNQNVYNFLKLFQINYKK